MAVIKKKKNSAHVFVNVAEICLLKMSDLSGRRKKTTKKNMKKTK